MRNFKAQKSALASPKQDEICHLRPYHQFLMGQEMIESAHRAVRAAIRDIILRWRIVLVHIHGVDFYQYLPESGVPVLPTLHLPPNCYSNEAFFPQRPATFLNCVSRTQHTLFGQANGVSIYLDLYTRLAGLSRLSRQSGSDQPLCYVN
jgi:hypothetical protein